MAGVVFLIPQILDSLQPPSSTPTPTPLSRTTTEQSTTTSTPLSTTTTTTATTPPQQPPPPFREQNPYTATTTWRPYNPNDSHGLPPDYNRHHLDRCVDPNTNRFLLRRRAHTQPTHPSSPPSSPTTITATIPLNNSTYDDANDTNDDNESPYTTTTFTPDIHNRLSLTLDRTLIYPTHPPSTALYYLPHPLTTPNPKITLDISIPGPHYSSSPQSPPYSEPLYRMARGPMWPWPHGPEYLITPARGGGGGSGACVSGVARMTRSKGVLGVRWSVLYRGFDARDAAAAAAAGGDAEARTCELLWQSGRWVRRGRDGAGDELVAVEEQTKELKLLVFQDGIGADRPLQDLLVAAWCVRLWHKMGPGPGSGAGRKRDGAMGSLAAGVGVGGDDIGGEEEEEGGDGGREGTVVPVSVAAAVAPVGVGVAGRRWSFVRRGTR